MDFELNGKRVLTCVSREGRILYRVGTAGFTDYHKAKAFADAHGLPVEPVAVPAKAKDYVGYAPTCRGRERQVMVDKARPTLGRLHADGTFTDLDPQAKRLRTAAPAPDTRRLAIEVAAKRKADRERAALIDDFIKRNGVVTEAPEKTARKQAVLPL